MKSRALGLFLLVIGAATGYFCVYNPLAEAARHEPKVSLYFKGAAACPICLIFGLIYLLMGDQAKSLVGERNKLSAFGWLITILGIGGGIVLYIWLKGQIERIGYKF